MTDNTKNDLAGALNSAGNFTKKAVARALTGSAASQIVRGSLPTMVLTSPGLDGSLTSAGSLKRAITRALSGAATLAGIVSKGISRALSGAAALAGTASKGTSRALSGAATTARWLTRAMTRSLVGLLGLAGAQTNVHANAASRITPASRTFTPAAESRTFTPKCGS